MKIAVWHNLPSGGGKRALYHHVKGLVARGHAVEVWCPATAERDYLPLSAFALEHRVAYARPPYPRWPWNRYAAWRCFKREFEAIDAHCRACAQKINAGGFDVLFAGNCIDTAVAPIARHVRVPSLLYNQEPQRWLYEARPELPWIAPPAGAARRSLPHRLNQWLMDHDALARLRASAREERESAAAFDLMLANSAFSRESILRAYGLDSKVCYLGIDADLFRVNDGGREPYIVGLGGLQLHKGIETAIAALATVPAARRPKLIWIGNLVDGGYETKMRQMAREGGVALEVRHLISDAELVDCLGRAAMMIYTSQLEPFGFAPLEANACGTPVVAVAEGGVRETVIDRVNGLLLPDRDAAALGAAILELLDQPELARRLGRTGAENVRRSWTWEKSVERLEHHLFSLVRREEVPCLPHPVPVEENHFASAASLA